MPWWFFVAGAAADLTLCAGVAAIVEGWCGIQQRRNELSEVVVPSRDIVLCEECAKQARRGSGLVLNWFGFVPHCEAVAAVVVD